MFTLFLFVARQETPLMLILKKELKKLFQDNKMVAVVQNNASNAEDIMILKNRLHKHGITVKFIPNQVTLSAATFKSRTWTMSFLVI